jgi:hypothetical protein
VDSSEELSEELNDQCVNNCQCLPSDSVCEARHGQAHPC